MENLDCMYVLRLAVLLSSILSLSVSAADLPQRQTDIVQTSQGVLRITPIYHGSVMLEFGGKVIYVDPFSKGNFSGLPKADLLVITHTHKDHLDPSMVDQLKKPDTVIVGPPAVIDTLNCAPTCGDVEALSDSESKNVMGIGFAGVPMYNLKYGPKPGVPWHHKGVGAGYVLSFGATRVYFSGDTECTAEMKALQNISIAFIAMNPPKTQSPADAANCVKEFKPKIVYPYHYGHSNLREFVAPLKDTGVQVRIRKFGDEP